MRYPKGCLDLSSPQDFMLLQQVLRSRHVTHDQLWRFFQIRMHEHRRRIFNWRMQRLVEHEFVWRATHGLETWVYSISERGAGYLIGRGDASAMVALGHLGHANENQLAHSVDINEIHLALLASGRLAGWKSDLEVRSQNELTGYGYAKDYDAIVSVEAGDRSPQFALEYERQPKAAHRYPPIREAIERESQISCIVYVMPAYTLLSYVAGFFERCPRAVYFGLLEDFRRSGVNADVMDWHRTRRHPLAEVLGGL